MKLTFIKGSILKYLLMVIVAVSVTSISIVSFAKKEKVGMASVEEVEDTLVLIDRINAVIVDIKKIRWEK